MTNSYSLMVLNQQSVAEKKHPFASITERHLQAIWLEQKYFKNLVTDSGEEVIVISPGIWNTEAGPDFLKASLLIGGKEVKGDVEIHFSDQGWVQHHHHVDARYDRVVFHLSLWKPIKKSTVVNRKGEKIIQSYLDDCLTISLGRITQLIDVDLYPYKKFVGSGKCAKTLFCSLSEKETKKVFQDAAHWRLTEKTTLIKSHVEESNLYLPSAFAMALGYKNNGLSFLEAFQIIYSHRDLEEDELLALGMKMFGFFSIRYQNKWSHSEKYKQLLESSKCIPIVSIPEISLQLNQIRPMNHPIRRLVLLCKMIKDVNFHLLFQNLSTAWDMSWEQIGRHNKKVLEQLMEIIPKYVSDYWNSHYLFEDKKDEYIPLLGNDIKREVIVNGFFPLLYEVILKRSNWQEIEAFQKFYGSLPAGKSGKTRYLVHRFFGDTPKGALLNKLDIEQGAFQIHRNFCVYYEASCENCPFVDLYKTYN